MLTKLPAFLGRALRTLAALAAAIVVLTLGLLTLGGLLLRFAWLRSRGAKAAALPKARRTSGARGEVIDVEVREVLTR